MAARTGGPPAIRRWRSSSTPASRSASSSSPPPGALNANLFAFLFGSILTVTRGDLLSGRPLGAAGLALIAFLYRALVAVALDEEAAQVSGVPVGLLNVVVAGARGSHDRALDADRRHPADCGADGAAGHRRFTCRAERELDPAIAMAIGLLSVFIGLTVSYYADLAPGGAIVLTAAAAFAVAAVAARFRPLARP